MQVNAPKAEAASENTFFFGVCQDEEEQLECSLYEGDYLVVTGLLKPKKSDKIGTVSQHTRELILEIFFLL